MTRKERYEYRKVNKLCTRCGNPVRGNHLKCVKCRKKNAEANKKKYHERLESGLCTLCGKRKAEVGSTLCEECHAKKKKSYYRHADEQNVKSLRKKKIQRRKRAKQGLCPICGKPKGAETIYCEKCLAYARQQSANSRSNNGTRHVGIPRSEWSQYGWCGKCGVAVNDGAKICGSCKAKIAEVNIRMRARMKEKRESWKQQGLCSLCGESPAVEGYKVCQACKDKLADMRQRYNKKYGKEVMPDGTE